MSIEKIYRVRVDFEYPAVNHDIDSIVDGLLRLSKSAEDASVFEGNAACGPYITAEYTTLVKAQDADGRFTRYLRRRKCQILGLTEEKQ